MFMLSAQKILIVKHDRLLNSTKLDDWYCIGSWKARLLFITAASSPFLRAIEYRGLFILFFILFYRYHVNKYSMCEIHSMWRAIFNIILCACKILKYSVFFYSFISRLTTFIVDTPLCNDGLSISHPHCPSCQVCWWILLQ